MAKSGVLSGKSFRSFSVNDDLVVKLVEAVKEGDVKARSTGKIQSIEVFNEGFRTHLVIGRLMIIPAKIIDSPEDFPIALMYGRVVKMISPEDISDMEMHKIGETEFDEFSKKDWARVKDQLFKNDQDKVASLIVFLPAWSNPREFISFHYTKDEAKLALLLTHQVFACYFDPRLSSAFDAILTDVDTFTLDVTDISTKINFPFLAEGNEKEFPNLEPGDADGKNGGQNAQKRASSGKKIMVLAADTVNEVLEEGEKEVIVSLDNALLTAMGSKFAHGCGETCNKCGEVHGGDHECKTADSEYINCEKCGKPTRNKKTQHCDSCMSHGSKKADEIGPDVSEAKSESVSPDTVDADIKQMTETLCEAAGVTASDNRETCVFCGNKFYDNEEHTCPKRGSSDAWVTDRDEKGEPKAPVTAGMSTEERKKLQDAEQIQDDSTHAKHGFEEKDQKPQRPYNSEQNPAPKKGAATFGVPPVNDETMEAIPGEPHNVPEVGEAHNMLEGVEQAKKHDGVAPPAPEIEPIDLNKQAASSGSPANQGSHSTIVTDVTPNKLNNAAVDKALKSLEASNKTAGCYQCNCNKAVGSERCPKCGHYHRSSSTKKSYDSADEKGKTYESQDGKNPAPKKADTADNPANENDSAPIVPKTDAEIKITARMGICEECGEKRSLNRNGICHQCEQEYRDQEKEASSKGFHIFTPHKDQTQNPNCEVCGAPYSATEHTAPPVPKQADTADNPAAMKDAEGIVQPKTDASIKDTAGPAVTNTANAKKASECENCGASLNPGNRHCNEACRKAHEKFMKEEEARIEKNKASSMKKVSYVAHVPGHKNSQGEAAPWVIKSHKDGHIISSHKTEAEAKKHLQDMHAHSGSADAHVDDLTVNGLAIKKDAIKDPYREAVRKCWSCKESVGFDPNGQCNACGVKNKKADTADNPSNEKGGEAAIEVKTDADIKTTASQKQARHMGKCVECGRERSLNDDNLCPQCEKKHEASSAVAASLTEDRTDSYTAASRKATTKREKHEARLVSLRKEADLPLTEDSIWDSITTVDENNEDGLNTALPETTEGQEAAATPFNNGEQAAEVQIEKGNNVTPPGKTAKKANTLYQQMNEFNDLNGTPLIEDFPIVSASTVPTDNAGVSTMLGGPKAVVEVPNATAIKDAMDTVAEQEIGKSFSEKAQEIANEVKADAVAHEDMGNAKPQTVEVGKSDGGKIVININAKDKKTASGFSPELEEVHSALSQIREMLQEVPILEGQPLGIELDGLYEKVKGLMQGIESRKFGSQHVAKIAIAVAALQKVANAAKKAAEAAPVTKVADPVPAPAPVPEVKEEPRQSRILPKELQDAVKALTEVKTVLEENFSPEDTDNRYAELVGEFDNLHSRVVRLINNITVRKYGSAQLPQIKIAIAALQKAVKAVKVPDAINLITTPNMGQNHTNVEHVIPESHETNIAEEHLPQTTEAEGAYQTHAEDANESNEDGTTKIKEEPKTSGFNFFFPGQVLKEFDPGLQHNLVDYPNDNNTGMIDPAVSGGELAAPGDATSGDLKLEEVELAGLPIVDLEQPLNRVSAGTTDFTTSPGVSTSPAAGCGIGRDGKPQVLDGAPLRMEDDIRGPMFTDEFYQNTVGVPGQFLANFKKAFLEIYQNTDAQKVLKTKRAGVDDKGQLCDFLKRVVGEIAATYVSVFKVTNRGVTLNRIPGTGEVHLDYIEQGSGLINWNNIIGSRIKALLEKVNDDIIQECIDEAKAQAAVWSDGSGGFTYEVFVRAESIDKDTLVMKYTFVTGTKS